MEYNFDQLTQKYKEMFKEQKTLAEKGFGLIPFWEEQLLLDIGAAILKNGCLFVANDYPIVFYMDTKGDKKRNDTGNGDLQTCKAIKDGYLNQGIAAWGEFIPKTYCDYLAWQIKKGRTVQLSPTT